MRRLILIAALLIAAPAVSDSREDYGNCVWDELDRGTAIALIGDLCLRLTEAPTEPKRDDEQDPYPFEKALRGLFAEEGSLIDPESAQFKDLVPSSQGFPAWCGQINSKNRHGGYVGWKYFVIRDRSTDRWRATSDNVDFHVGGREIESTCKKYYAWERENWHTR